MEPILTGLESNGVAVRRVDVTVESGLVRRYGVRQTPTYLVVSNGEEVTRLVGTHTAEELLQALRTPVGGPLVDTGSQGHRSPQGWDDLDAMPGFDEAPQTRLAPVSGGVSGTPRLAGFGRTVDATSRPSAKNRPSDANLGRSSQSEAMPSVSAADAIERARAATVRLRVHDDHGFGVGTGTVVDVHGDEALVMTCGHLFRDTDGKGRIEVDVFYAGETKTVAGQLIDYDANERDIAVVAIQPGVPMKAVEMIRVGEKPRTGQSVFSFGCDRGADPSRRDTRVTAVDKYNQHINMSNLEIDGAPIDGRSGGGLFDMQGRLIGVCNAADYKGDTGFYTGPGSIHWQLDRVNLGHLVQANAGNQGSHVNAEPNRLAGAGEPLVQLADARLSDQPMELTPANPARADTAVSDPSLGFGTDQEVIVIIRDKNSSAPSKVMTIDQPSQDFMRNLMTQTR